MEIDFNANSTHFAAPERDGMADIYKQNEQLREASFLEEVFSKIPIMFLILNDKRQIVYLNSLLATEFEAKKFSHTLGYRPGEMLSCENAFTEPSGCGTTHACKFCGLINTIIEADAKNQLVVNEALISTDYLGILDMVNYEVSAKPFEWDDSRFFIVTLADISYKKRKEQLERTFFHDLLNKISSASGIIDLVSCPNDEESQHLLDMLKRSVFDLSNEIKFQRNLSLAEKGELVVNRTRINSIEIINYIKEDFYPYETVWNKRIQIPDNTESFDFYSDYLLVNRIFTNLIKNSLEAIDSGQEIEISITQKAGNMLFYVKNSLVLADEIKHLIFRKNFSTKGEGRGVGTYSVKLFAEHYLKGKTWFTSSKEEGTIFYVELPLKLEDVDCFS